MNLGRATTRASRTALVTGAVLIAVLASVHLALPAAPVAAQRSARATPAPVATGFDHACAVTPTGSVECWGDNTNGELGVALSVTMSAVPVAANMPGGWHAVAVAVGDHHSCALLADGRVGCWGSDIGGQLGTAGGDQSPGPVLVDLPTGRSAVAISANANGTCVISDDGKVWCWGFQGSGELGQPTNITYETPQQVIMPAGETVVDVSMGSAHTCAVLDTGAITCWGSNTFGQLGNGTTAPSSTTGSASTPFMLATGVRAIDVAAGTRSTCAIGEQGAVYCWGHNWDGRLGDGTTTDRFTPGPLVPAPSRPAVQVTVGDLHACALLDDGTMGCWGGNDNGQVGDGTTIRRLSPVVVAPGTLARTLVTGWYTTCAVLTNGTVTCWGRNNNGQVGDGTTTARTSPLAARSFAEGTRLAAVAAGGSHTCVLNTAGLVWCWGLNTSGQLGRGSITTRERELGEPVALPGIGRAKAIKSGSSHTCALLVDGNVACWGGNGFGQLGDGTTTGRATAATVVLPGYIRATAISLGGRHTCALLADGNVTCWGGNDSGQLGDGTTNPQLSPPSPITLAVSGAAAVSVHTGTAHTCALLSNGEMTCWGSNSHGQVGDGTTSQRTSPVTVSTAPGTRAVGMGTGNNHTCALVAGGSVTCWGDNQWGQLGTGTHGVGTNLLAPTGTVSLPGGHPEAISLAVGTSHTCALLDAGGASCWGYNGTGGVGDGTFTPSVNSPVAVAAPPAGRAIRSVSAGGAHSCAVLDNGTLSCWGQNFNSQLGIADSVDRNSPALAELPHEPSGLTAVTTPTTVLLSWSEATSPFQPQTWSIEASTDGTTWWPATVSAAVPTGTTVSGLTTGIEYRFRVTSTTPLRTLTTTLAAAVSLPSSVTAPGATPAATPIIESGPATPRRLPSAEQIAALPLRLLVDPALVRRGVEVAFEIDGFNALEPVMVLVASTPLLLDEVTTDADGLARIHVLIPADLGAGLHTLAVWAPDSGIGFRQVFGGDTPTAGADARSTRPDVAALPATGTEPAALLVTAMTLGLLGWWLRRRKPAI